MRYFLENENMMYKGLTIYDVILIWPLLDQVPAMSYTHHIISDQVPSPKSYHHKSFKKTLREIAPLQLERP